MLPIFSMRLHILQTYGEEPENKNRKRMFTMTMLQKIILLAALNLLLAVVIVYMAARRHPSRVYYLYVLGIFGSMAGAALLRQTLALCIGTVLYAGT